MGGGAVGSTNLLTMLMSRLEVSRPVPVRPPETETPMTSDCAAPETARVESPGQAAPGLLTHTKPCAVIRDDLWLLDSGLWGDLFCSIRSPNKQYQ